MKKVLSLVLVLTLVLGSLTAFAAPASDVAGTEYEAAVERLSQLGVLTGYPDGTFKPNNTITRAEFAAAVVRVKGLESAALAAQGATVFTDVPAGGWAAGYVNIASKLGIVKGMGDGTFAPNAHVTYEQAVTMVMRALGYEAAAEARGGYPYGYLIVANENDLLDQVKGVQGLPAVRGLVAQLLDNALEIPMMIQVGVGFNSQPLWVKSGTQGTTAVTLLDELGFKNVEGMVTIVNEAKASIKVGDTTLTAPSGFDYNFYEGLTVKAWYASGKIAAVSALNEAKYDATVVDGAKVKLVGEGKSYALVEGLEAKASDYAKVVLNSDGKVAFVKYYDLEFIVVEEVKDNMVFDLNDEELDVKDYTITKDGRTITVDDLELGDILFYDYAKDFAVVYNESKSGEIERVYSDSVKVSGKVYDLGEGALYLDGTTLGTLTATVLGQMMGEEGTVEMFFNHAGEIVLVEGNRGVTPVTDSSFYGFLATDTAQWNKTDERAGSTPVAYWTFDVVNQEGKTIKYDLRDYFVKNEKSATDNTKLTGTSRTFINNVDANDAWTTGTMTANTPVKVTLNEDGNVVKVEKLIARNALAFEIDDEKVTANSVEYRLQPSTLIFYKDASANNKVVKLEDAKNVIVNVSANAEIVTANGRVVAIYAHNKANLLATTTNYTGYVANVRKLSSGAYEFTLEVLGKTEIFLTTSKTLNLTINDLLDKIVRVTVSDKNGTIDSHQVVTGTPVTVTERSTTARTINGVYELNPNAVIYDAGNQYKVIGLRDINKDDSIVIYFDGSSDRFVSYVVKNAVTATPPTTISLATVSTAGVTVTGLTYKNDNAELNDYYLAVTDDGGTTTYVKNTLASGQTQLNFAAGLVADKFYTLQLFRNTPVAANALTEAKEYFVK